MPGETSSKKTVSQLFNPNLLDRTIVAIPLIRAMADSEEAEKWMDDHPSLAVKGFNTVIFLAAKGTLMGEFRLAPSPCARRF